MAFSVDSLIGVVIVAYLAIFVVVVIAHWRIWSKAGCHGAWSLLMIVPLINVVSFLYLAFAEWPAAKRARALDAGGGQRA
jgi:hypothetical protein